MSTAKPTSLHRLLSPSSSRCRWPCDPGACDLTREAGALYAGHAALINNGDYWRESPSAAEERKVASRVSYEVVPILHYYFWVRHPGTKGENTG